MQSFTLSYGNIFEVGIPVSQLDDYGGKLGHVVTRLFVGWATIERGDGAIHCCIVTHYIQLNEIKIYLTFCLWIYYWNTRYVTPVNKKVI